MTQQIQNSVKGIVALMAIFIIWTVIFALLFYVLGVYEDQFEAEGDFSETGTVFGYFMVVFQNAIGDVRVPTFVAK